MKEKIKLICDELENNNQEITALKNAIKNQKKKKDDMQKGTFSYCSNYSFSVTNMLESGKKEQKTEVNGRTDTSPGNQNRVKKAVKRQLTGGEGNVQQSE
jgi:Flp pilus assembly protein TadG